jgi:Na+-driven multidrug efflux pump
MRKAFYVILFLAVFAALTAIFIRNFMIGLFLGTPTETVLDFAFTYLNTTVWFYIPLGFIFLYRSAIQGLGNGLVSLLGGVFEVIGRGIMIIFFLDRYGFIIVALASPAAWVITGFPLFFYYLHWKRKTMASLHGENQSAATT